MRSPSHKKFTSLTCYIVSCWSDGSCGSPPSLKQSTYGFHSFEWMLLGGVKNISRNLGKTFDMSFHPFFIWSSVLWMIGGKLTFGRVKCGGGGIEYRPLFSTCPSLFHLSLMKDCFGANVLHSSRNFSSFPLSFFISIGMWKLWLSYLWLGSLSLCKGGRMLVLGA